MNIESNSIARRIQGGTVTGSGNLCLGCRFCLRRVSGTTGRQEIRCDALQGSPIVRVPVAQCSRYLDQGSLTLYEMKEVAWVIEARGKKIGFLSPEEMERRRQNGPPQSPVGF